MHDLLIINLPNTGLCLTLEAMSRCHDVTEAPHSMEQVPANIGDAVNCVHQLLALDLGVVYEGSPGCLQGQTTE